LKTHIYIFKTAKKIEKPWNYSHLMGISGFGKCIKQLFCLWHLNHWTKRFAFLTNVMDLVSSKMPESIFMKKFWGLPKWQEETPKRQKRLECVAFGALPPMECGVTDWKPHESEYFVNYGDFFGISWPPCPGRPSGPAAFLLACAY